MWVCRTCGQNNEDGAASCMLCGGNDREHYEPTPAPRVVIPPPEERVAKKPTIDTSLRRPTFGTGSSTSGGSTSRASTGTTSRTSSGGGIDTSLRRPTFGTGSSATGSSATGSSSSSESSRSTTPTTATSTTTTGPTGSAPVKRVGRWWKSPLVFLIVSLVAFYPIGQLAANNGALSITALAAALPIIALIVFGHKFCYRRGVRIIGLVYQIICTVSAFYVVNHVFNRIATGVKYYLIMLLAIMVTLILLKIISAVRCFRARRVALAIIHLVLVNTDLYFTLACLFDVLDSLPL